MEEHLYSKDEVKNIIDNPKPKNLKKFVQINPTKHIIVKKKNNTNHSLKEIKNFQKFNFNVFKNNKNTYENKEEKLILNSTNDKTNKFFNLKDIYKSLSQKCLNSDLIGIKPFYKLNEVKSENKFCASTNEEEDDDKWNILNQFFEKEEKNQKKKIYSFPTKSCIDFSSGKIFYYRKITTRENNKFLDYKNKLAELDKLKQNNLRGLTTKENFNLENEDEKNKNSFINIKNKCSLNNDNKTFLQNNNNLIQRNNIFLKGLFSKTMIFCHSKNYDEFFLTNDVKPKIYSINSIDFYPKRVKKGENKIKSGNNTILNLLPFIIPQKAIVNYYIDYYKSLLKNHDKKNA